MTPYSFIPIKELRKSVCFLSIPTQFFMNPLPPLYPTLQSVFSSSQHNSLLTRFQPFTQPCSQFSLHPNTILYEPTSNPLPNPTVSFLFIPTQFFINPLPTLYPTLQFVFSSSQHNSLLTHFHPFTQPCSLFSLYPNTILY